ncbi:unnamed protein product [Caenorhabditis angaria]|uniref:Ground-like domain-containing protein n=1 Tax=Caenorhabditis angaria TaxID=860376 RepID=A0A9P1IZ45_9PELO|nr:unnamed protein product [Caenorhabditis angaria]
MMRFLSSILVLATAIPMSQAFFFGGGSGAACGCPAPPACAPPPPPSAPIGCGGGGYAPPPPQPYFPPVQPAYQPQYAQAPSQPIPLQQAPIQSYNPQPIPQPIPRAGGAYASPVKRQTNEENTGVDQSEGYRVKRDDEAVFDPKCNSEDLKSIIIQHISANTATSKRNIQSAAADAIGGRIDVICSRGTFSYIVNTELYCETEHEGTTCFAFKQSS